MDSQLTPLADSAPCGPPLFPFRDADLLLASNPTYAVDAATQQRPATLQRGISLKYSGTEERLIQGMLADPSQKLIEPPNSTADGFLPLHKQLLDPAISHPKPGPPKDLRRAAVDRILRHLELPGRKYASSDSSVGGNHSGSSSGQGTPKGDAAAEASALNRVKNYQQQQPGLQHASTLQPPVPNMTTVQLQLGGSSHYQPQPPGMYDTATACEHCDYHKCLRVKKGFTYYVCYLCGAKWRDPAPRRQQRP